MTRSTLGPVLLATLFLPAIAHADEITSVSFTGSAADPTITISGSGFSPVPVPTTIAYPGYTGYDYGDQLYIQDQSSDTPFEAGRGNANTNLRDYIGLVLLDYSDSSITYSLGSAYSNYYYPIGLYQLKEGDPFFVHTDADFYGTVTYNSTVTPEPSSFVLAATGALSSLAALKRRRTTSR